MPQPAAQSPRFILVQSRNDAVRYLLLELSPLLAIPLAAVLVQDRDGPAAQVPAHPEAHQQAAGPAAAHHGVAAAPQCVAKVVDVPRPAPQADLADLALVPRHLLEALALVLGQRLDGDARGVQQGAREDRERQVAVGRAGAGNDGGEARAAADQRGGCGARDQHGVERVDGGVEDAHRHRGADGELLGAQVGQPEDLLRAGAGRHDEQQEARQRQVQPVEQGNARGRRGGAGGRGRDAGQADRGERALGRAVVQEVVLPGDVGQAHTDEGCSA